ncbi:MAG TPA: hypothetical protein VGS07_25005 [Thermoanaerobaculia bacterium]|jgi:hypothetical protein|nr:hypothetical protein [Thermoanaerobaculia bacterium]
MKKQRLRKLTIARETLRRLEEQGLQDAQGGSGRTCAPSIESICFCLTDLCISEGYTGCVACNS